MIGDNDGPTPTTTTTKENKTSNLRTILLKPDIIVYIFIYLP